MQVRQAKINEGNVKWYVTTANGYAVSEGFVSRVEAEAELARLRQPEDDEPIGAGADPFGRPDPRTHPEFWTE